MKPKGSLVGRLCAALFTAILMSVIPRIGINQGPAMAGPQGLDVGIMVVTVEISSITKGNSPDWFGPYYVMRYNLKSLSDTSSRPNGSFLAGGGCGDCWQTAYSFATRDVALIAFTLFDDQSCCLSGMQPVHIAGSWNGFDFTVGGDTCRVWSSASLEPLLTPDSCASYSFSTTGAGSSTRSATVKGTVTVRSALQFQTWSRQQMYLKYEHFMNDFNAASDCLARWNQEAAEMQYQIVPLIQIGFGLGSIALTVAEAIIAGTLTLPLVSAWEAGDFIEKARDYAAHAGTFSAPTLVECGNITTLLWYLKHDLSTMDHFNSLGTAVASLRGDLNVLQTDLTTDDRQTVAEHFKNQSTNLQTARSNNARLIQILKSIVSGELVLNVCLQGCRDAAWSLLNFFRAMQAELEADTAYVIGTSNLLDPGGGGSGGGGGGERLPKMLGSFDPQQ